MANRIILNETSYFGRGSREKVVDEIKARGYQKILVVTDRSLVEAKVAEMVIDVLENAGITYFVYLHIKPNPTVKNVEDGLHILKENNKLKEGFNVYRSSKRFIKYW